MLIVLIKEVFKFNKLNFLLSQPDLRNKVDKKFDSPYQNTVWFIHNNFFSNEIKEDVVRNSTPYQSQKRVI